jgi:ABC-type phosphate transport system permease subunit
MARPGRARRLAHALGGGALAALALAAVAPLAALGAAAVGAAPRALAGGLARTFGLWLAATSVALPAGLLLGACCDRATSPRAFGRLARQVVEQLARTPPVIWGSLLAATAGGTDPNALAPLALALVTLPRVALRTARAFDDVPAPLRDAATALGGGRRAALAHVVWPAARRAALGGALEAAARAGGEAAPLIALAAVVPANGPGPLHLSAARVAPGPLAPTAAASALALVALVAALHGAARAVRRGAP